MSQRIHPNDALFAGEKRYPIINACEHFAGSEKLISKALELQEKMGGVFDITMDCEDGAKEGQEKAHAEMVVAMANSSLNRHRKAGVRIHDHASKHRRDDVHDRATYRYFWELVQKAGVTGVALPDEAISRWFASR